MIAAVIEVCGWSKPRPTFLGTEQKMATKGQLYVGGDSNGCTIERIRAHVAIKVS